MTECWWFDENCDPDGTTETVVEPESEPEEPEPESEPEEPTTTFDIFDDDSAATALGYFNSEYKLQAIWLGLTWFSLGFTPIIANGIASPGCAYETTSGITSYVCNTSGSFVAWDMSTFAVGSSFNTLGIFWLLAYIENESTRIMQKVYYRAIAWIIPISWLLVLVTFILFIVGFTQEETGGADAKISDPIFAVFLLLIVGGMQALAWFLAPRVVKFYRWDE